MVIYFMNTSIIPSDFEGIVIVYKSSIEEIKEIIKNENWISAVGHESTAQIMSIKTGLNIKMNRLNINAKFGDKFICFQLKNRGVEGKIYTINEMEHLECIWKILIFKD